MSLIAKKKKGDYSTAPEGLWAAVCIDVVDLGLVETPWGEKEQVEIRWAIDEQDPDSSKGWPHLVRWKGTLSLHEKSRLRPMLEAWRGKKFTAEELEGFDLERLVGANCQLQIVHNITDKGTFANVQAVVPAPKNGMKLRAPEGFIRKKDRAHESANGNGSSESDQDKDDWVPF